MVQTPKELSDQMFEYKYNIIKPIIAQYNWSTIKKIVIELCIDEIENIINMDVISRNDEQSKYYEKVKDYLYNM